MSELGTFDRILAEVGQALLPLRDALGSADAFTGLLLELGWTASDIPQPLRDLGASVETLYDSLRRLLGDGGLNSGTARGDGGAAANPGSVADEAARVLTAAQNVLTGIQTLENAPDSAFPPALVADGFKTLFPRQLVDFLILTYLMRYHPKVAWALRALGIAKSSYAPATGNRPSHRHLVLDPDDLAQVLADPSLVLANAYGWGTPEFDFEALASQVDNVLMAMGLDVRVREANPDAVAAVRDADPAGRVPPVDAVTVLAFDQAVGDDARTTASVQLIPVPPAQ